MRVASICIHLKLGESIASVESRKESCVIESLIEGSIGGGSITQHKICGYFFQNVPEVVLNGVIPFKN